MEALRGDKWPRGISSYLMQLRPLTRTDHRFYERIYTDPRMWTELGGVEEQDMAAKLQRDVAAVESDRHWVLVIVPRRRQRGYTFFEPSQQPPSAAWVSIDYRSEDGHGDVSLSQHAAGDQPDQYNLMLDDDDWQTITCNGVDVQVRGGSQTQAHIQRDQTFVFLTSESLTSKQLGTVAAALKPAPTDSPV